MYTITFVNPDGTLISTVQVAHGATPEYTGATPEQAMNGNIAYTFTGWDRAFAPATADATYTAKYSEHAVSVTVTFVNYDGTVLETKTVPYGSAAKYTGATPVRPGDTQYDFSGWDVDLSNVTKDTTATAQFRAHSSSLMEVILNFFRNFVNMLKHFIKTGDC